MGPQRPSAAASGYPPPQMSKSASPTSLFLLLSDSLGRGGGSPFIHPSIGSDCATQTGPFPNSLPRQHLVLGDSSQPHPVGEWGRERGPSHQQPGPSLQYKREPHHLPRERCLQQEEAAKKPSPALKFLRPPSYVKGCVCGGGGDKEPRVPHSSSLLSGQDPQPSLP